MRAWLIVLACMLISIRRSATQTRFDCTCTRCSQFRHLVKMAVTYSGVSTDLRLLSGCRNTACSASTGHFISWPRRRARKQRQRSRQKMQVLNSSQRLARIRARFQEAKLEEQLQVSFAPLLHSSTYETRTIMTWDNIWNSLLP